MHDYPSSNTVGLSHPYASQRWHSIQRPELVGIQNLSLSRRRSKRHTPFRGVWHTPKASSLFSGRLLRSVVLVDRNHRWSGPTQRRRERAVCNGVHVHVRQSQSRRRRSGVLHYCVYYVYHLFRHHAACFLLGQLCQTREDDQPG